MKYENTIHGSFCARPNRFLAEVKIDGKSEMVHVKNTGRCKELLHPQAEVILQKAENENRKTKYDLIAVYKKPLGWVNIDSQAPNRVVLEWLKKQDYTYIRPEYTHGDSRIDFYMEKGEEKYLMEVKGCTLEINGIGYFPDAPTLRGIKHLKELTEAVKEGYHCMVAFVIQMEGVQEVRANAAAHPEFKEALDLAEAAGVEKLFLRCKVGKDEIVIV